jgi:biotin carboxyl carrier protein
MPDVNDESRLNIDGTLYETVVPSSYTPKWYAPDERRIKAFIPGTVIEMKVKVGSRVSEGDLLLILDAMKMYNEITSPASGKVAEVAVSAGERVEKNQLLIRLE